MGLTGPVQNLGGTAGHLPDGYQLRDFRIERVLGEGGFSVVYLATDLRLEREVAIKEYMPTALATRNADLSVQVRSSAHHREAFEAGLRSFINEAKLLAHFEHRALVKVHQFWQERGTAYMVMPHYAGPTLKSWIKQQHGQVDAEWLERFFYLLMDALETLHRENCLHRDVAPDNILMVNDGSSPLLLDFGAARRVIGDLTQALTVILKPGFAPIEQYAESASMRQGPWTDVYALCAVAHFMITGKAPTPAVSRVLADDLVPLSVTAAGKFAPAFLAALDAGLTVRPQQRPQNIGALRALMEGAAPDNTLTAPPARHADLVAPPAALLPTFAPPEGDDDEKTQLVTGSRESVLPARPPTVSPSKPASFPLDAESTGGATDQQAFEPRFPSRSMREQAATEGNDRFAWLPLVIGGVAIAAVIAVAWYLVGWFNSQADLDRTRRSTAPTPAYAAPAATPPVAVEPVAPAVPTPSPAPSAAVAQVSEPPAAAAVPVSSPATTAAEAEAPAPKLEAAALETPKTEPSMAEPKAEAVKAEPAKAEPKVEPAQVEQTKVEPVKVEDARIEPTKAEAARPEPAKPEPARSESTKVAAASEAAPNKPPAALAVAPATTTKPPAAPASKPAPTPPAKPAAEAKPFEANAASSSTSTANGDLARSPVVSSPLPYAPPALTEVAPLISAPTVKTVDATPPAAAPIIAATAPQVAAVDPARSAPPQAQAALVPLKPISRPKPTFPREALRANVDKGLVTARLFVAADGSVTRVDIVKSNPARVFEREVRETAMRWRYEAPGQPRQTDVEFLFDRFEGQ